MEKRGRYMDIEETILRHTCISLDSRSMIQLTSSYFWYFKCAFNTWIHAYWKIFRHCRLPLVLVELYYGFYSTFTKIIFCFLDKSRFYHCCSIDKQVSLQHWCAAQIRTEKSGPISSLASHMNMKSEGTAWQLWNGNIL